jgi:hypothetical protein
MLRRAKSSRRLISKAKTTRREAVACAIGIYDKRIRSRSVTKTEWSVTQRTRQMIDASLLAFSSRLSSVSGNSETSTETATHRDPGKIRPQTLIASEA